MKAPDFWQRSGLLSTLLAPAGWAYASAGWLRHQRTTPHKAAVPVICVGNLVAGGAGKTPTVLALADLLADHAPHALLRGYGGRLTGPVQVEPAHHSAQDVGDEALLLARHLPTWVARHRPAGADAAAEAGAGLILMDDGFQNPSLAKDISLLVVDSAQGFGNGHCIPAGPLREPIARGLARVDALVLIGNGELALPPGIAPTLPLFRARIRPDASPGLWQDRAVAAFAGIGRPQKLFQTLADLGADIRATRAFADHHPYSEADLQSLADLAAQHRAHLVTTTKDHVRLPPSWQQQIEPLPVRLAFEAPDAVAAWLEARLSAIKASSHP